MSFDLSTPITASEIVAASLGQVSHGEAELFCKGMSPGVGVLGRCIEARCRCLARRCQHPALPRARARTFAKQLAGVIPADALRGMLQRENGLREIGDELIRFRIGQRLDELLERSALDALRAAE